MYQINSARSLKAAVEPLATIHPDAGRRLHPKYVYRTIELAFMGVCAAWEDFLEASMVRYLADAETNSGYSPSLRVGSCVGISHAFEVLSGKPGYCAAMTEAVKADCPVLISVDNGNRTFHIQAVVGIDADKFTAYDPALNRLEQYNLANCVFSNDVLVLKRLP